VSDAKVKIEDVKAGTGDAVKDGDHVVMHYTGWLEETEGSGKPGKKFDSSVDRDQPFETPIGVGYVIKGWDLGVVGMKAGGIRRLIIPHELGYGKYGVEPDIPGFATLIFDLELLKIK
jgi:FKBP-type peptidyl-prolyl cis-trans isomerase